MKKNIPKKKYTYKTVNHQAIITADEDIKADGSVYNQNDLNHIVSAWKKDRKPQIFRDGNTIKYLDNFYKSYMTLYAEIIDELPKIKTEE